jgi:ribosomal protein S3AE
MVSPELLAQIEALSPEDRWEVHGYIEELNFPGFELTEDQKDLIRRRDAEIDADPSIMVPLDEHIARVRAMFQ